MRIPLFALALLIATPSFSQMASGVGPFSGYPFPGPRLASPTTPNHDFPLHVWLRVHGLIWDGAYEFYTGHGKFQIASANSATPNKPINFEYECGVAFRNPAVNQFQARWIIPDKTLQILLYDPDHPNKPRTCNLSALAHPPQKIPY
jgi:hypothetical protein